MIQVVPQHQVVMEFSEKSLIAAVEDAINTLKGKYIIEVWGELTETCSKKFILSGENISMAEFSFHHLKVLQNFISIMEEYDVEYVGWRITNH